MNVGYESLYTTFAVQAHMALETTILSFYCS